MWAYRKLPISPRESRETHAYHVLQRGGFTLVEVLIATSILAIVGGLVTGLFSTIMRHKDSSSSSQLLADDGRIMLTQIARDIQTNTVDYDEYYNEALYGATESDGKPFPGQRFGEYASRFYTVTDSSKNTTGGCSKDTTSCISVGANPSDNTFVHTANAFRQAGKATLANLLCDNDGNSTVSGYNIECVKRLFLISGDGLKRTFLAPKQVSYPNQSAKTSLLSKVVLSRLDKKGDAMPAGFRCDPPWCPTDGPGKVEISIANYKNSSGAVLKNVKNMRIPNMDALTKSLTNNGIADAYANDFLPLSPSRTNITDLKFYISPVEDPHKGFSEDLFAAGATERVSHQPSVTIVLTVEPASNQISGTKFPPMTLQTTVTPGSFTDVPSYPPVVDKIQ